MSTSYKCQDCSKPLAVLSANDRQFQDVLKVSKSLEDIANQEQQAGITKKATDQGIPCFVDEQLLALRMADLIANSFTEGKIRLQDTICNECFEKIFKRIDEEMKDQEQEKMKYAEQLRIIESDLMRSRSTKELQELQDEEKRLDQELAQLEAEERAQEL